jgi:predicted CoA-binding protein
MEGKGILMATLNELVQDFLDQKHIAVVGVSDQRETGCNAVYRKFKEAGYHVSPVNPRLSVYDGDPCYPDLKAIPTKPDGVFLLTSPAVTEAMVQQCVELGIQWVWMHCMLGTKPGLAASLTSVSPNAVDMCHAHGITVIPGACPNQFLKPDFGHGLMRVIFRSVGFHQLAQG